MKRINYLLSMMSGVLPQHIRSLPGKKKRNTSWTKRHQGKQECARRRRQMAKGQIYNCE